MNKKIIVFVLAAIIIAATATGIILWVNNSKPATEPVVTETPIVEEVVTPEVVEEVTPEPTAAG